MDVVKFVKSVNRLCKNQSGCAKCPILEKGMCMASFGDYSVENIEETISKVEQWAKDHPVKTRQSEFLKMFPNAQMSVDCDVIWMCPKYIDETYCPKGDCHNIGCRDCKRKFWLAEVADND